MDKVVLEHVVSVEGMLLFTPLCRCDSTSKFQMRAVVSS